jgi:hypothetical protein
MTTEAPPRRRITVDVESGLCIPDAVGTASSRVPGGESSRDCSVISISFVVCDCRTADSPTVRGRQPQRRDCSCRRPVIRAESAGLGQCGDRSTAVPRPQDRVQWKNHRPKKRNSTSRRIKQLRPRMRVSAIGLPICISVAASSL